jgi:hypothetical protein
MASEARGRMSMGGATSPKACATYALLGPSGPLECFLFSSCFSRKTINTRKSPGQFEFRKVLEMSKYIRQVFLVM